MNSIDRATPVASLPIRGLRIVRLADYSPLENLVSLERTVFASSQNYDVGPWDLEALQMDLPGKAELSLVAVDRDGSAQGFLIASRRANGAVHIHRFAVSPSRQGSGLGSWLLAQLISRSAAGLVTVNCDAGNTQAIALYGSAGFIRSGANVDGKPEFLLRLADGKSSTFWYVYTATRAESGHAAHIPRLVASMKSDASMELVPYGMQEFPSFSGTLSWFRIFLDLVRTAREQRVDLIFVRIHWPLAALLFLASKAYPASGFRVVLWSSGGVGYLPGERATPRERAYRFAHRFALRYLNDAVFTGPPTLLKEYRSRYRIRPNKLILGCNDVSIKDWRDLASKADVTSRDGYETWLAAPQKLIYLHGVDLIRGADRLPDVMSRIHRSLPGAKLLVVGDGPLDGRLKSRADIICLGRVPNVEAAAILARADCMLVPSRQEGFPRVLLEAMALGVPPVAFDVGGCRDVVGTDLAELIADSGDLEAFASAVVCAAANATDHNFKSRLMKRAAEFDTPVVARGLTLALRSLARGDRKHSSWLARSYWNQVFTGGRDGGN